MSESVTRDGPDGVQVDTAATSAFYRYIATGIASVTLILAGVLYQAAISQQNQLVTTVNAHDTRLALLELQTRQIKEGQDILLKKMEVVIVQTTALFENGNGRHEHRPYDRPPTDRSFPDRP